MSSVTLERTTNTDTRMTSSICAAEKSRTSMAGVSTLQNGSLSKLQSLHGIFAIYKKEGPTSADVLNALKKALLKGWCVFMSCESWYIQFMSFLYIWGLDSHKTIIRILFFYCITSLSLHRGRCCKSQPSEKEEATFKNWPWRHPGQQCFWCTW